MKIISLASGLLALVSCVWLGADLAIAVIAAFAAAEAASFAERFARGLRTLNARRA